MGNTIVQLRYPFSSGPMIAGGDPTATMSSLNKLTQTNAPVALVQIRLARRSPAYWRVTIDNPPISVLCPVLVKQFLWVIDAIEPARTPNDVLVMSTVLKGANNERRTNRTAEL